MPQENSRSLARRLRGLATEEVKRGHHDLALDDLVERLQFEAARHGSILLEEIEGIAAAALLDFPPLVRLETTHGPEFPLACLPHWLSDWVAAEAEATQTPLDLAGALGLAALATACAKRVRVEVRPSYTEPTNLMVAVALPPGNRKSEVFARASDPILAVELELREASRPRIARANEELETKRERLKKVRRGGAKADPGKRDAAESESQQLAQEIAELEERQPQAPRLITDDATPEAIALLLRAQGGRIALWSPEGGEFFEILRGRYSGNSRPNLGVFLKGHAGDLLSVDRVRGDSFSVAEPALTVAAAVQPAVIRALREESTFRERGGLARILWVLPESKVGRRSWRTDGVPESVRHEYASRLGDLVTLGRERHASMAVLEPDAHELWTQFGEALEPDLREGGALDGLADWASKLPGAVARVACLLHTADWVDQRDPWSEPIDATTMSRAIELGRYFLGHARAAFSLIADSEKDAGAAKILRTVLRRGASEVSARDVWQRVKGGRFEETADVQPCLERLVELGYLAEHPGPPMQVARGRPPSRRYLVNPLAFEGEDAG